MLPSEEVVSELTRIVWSTLLGLEAAERGATDEAAAFVSSVDISGAWHGTIAIYFTRALAQKVTQAMLASSEGDATAADVTDVIGELANVVGGNLKGVLAGPCTLSTPRVEAAEFRPPVPGGSQSWFECGGQPFSVTVLERESRSES